MRSLNNINLITLSFLNTGLYTEEEAYALACEELQDEEEYALLTRERREWDTVRDYLYEAEELWEELIDG